MGLTHHSDADGPLKGLNTTRMPMAHDGTYAQLGCKWLTMGLIRTAICRWLSQDLHAHGHRSLSTGLTLNSDAGGSPRDLHTTRMPMAHRRTYTQHGCQWLTIGLTDADGSP